MAPRSRKKPEDVGNAIFIGSTYSNEELLFLAGDEDNPGHLGEPPEVAIPDDGELPLGVNEAAIRPILDRTFRLQMLQEAAQKQSGDKNLTLWVGFDAIRDICTKTLDWNATVVELKARTQSSDGPVRRAAGAPSLHMWDPDTDIPYAGGVGADADIVRTALDGNERIPLFIALRDTGIGSIKSIGDVAKFLRGGKKAVTGEAPTPATAEKSAAQKLLDSTPNALIHKPGAVTSLVECPICGHTEVYETGKPASKRNAEKDALKHLKSARNKRDQHQLLAKRLLSGKAGTGKPAPALAPDVEDDTEDEGSEE